MAQQPTQCQQWQVKHVFVANLDGDTVLPTNIELGWEPVGPMDFICGSPCRARMTLRRCTR
jgi:hypothetical protein